MVTSYANVMSTESIAVTGLVGYSILLFASLYQYFYHCKLRTDGTGGRYIQMKTRFFAILAFSALFDIPTYIGCLAENSPDECEWDNIWYLVVWVMHLIATCGYSLALTVPPMLWDDIINRREGKFLFEEYPRNTSRLVFMVCIVLYWAVVLYSIICILVFFKVSDHTAYYHNRGSIAVVSQLAALMEPMVIFILSMTCLFYGVKLQRHVLNTGVSTGVQRKLLVQLNIVLCLIVLCYLARAVLLLILFGPTPDYFRSAMDQGYLAWLLGTRWLCHIVCSLFLLRVMSKNSSNTGSGSGTSSVFNTPLKVKEGSDQKHKDVFLHHVLDSPGQRYGHGQDSLEDSDMDLNSVMSVLQEDYHYRQQQTSTSNHTLSSSGGDAEEPLLYSSHSHGSFSPSQQSHDNLLSQSQSQQFQSQGISGQSSSSFTQYVNQLLSTWSFKPTSQLGKDGEVDGEGYSGRLQARQQKYQLERERQGQGHGTGTGMKQGSDQFKTQQQQQQRQQQEKQQQHLRRQYGQDRVSGALSSSVEVGSPSTLSYLSQVSENSLLPPGGNNNHDPGGAGRHGQNQNHHSGGHRHSQSDSEDASGHVGGDSDNRSSNSNVFDPRKYQYQSDRYISVDSTVSN